MVSAECLGCTTRLNYNEQLLIQMLKKESLNGQVGLRNPIELCWATLNTNVEDEDLEWSVLIGWVAQPD